MVNIYYEFLKQKKEIRQMTEENTSIQQNTDPSTGVESTGSGESIDWEKKYHEEVKQSKSYRSRAQEAESSLDKFNQKQSSDRKKKLESEGKLQQIIDEQDKLIIDLKGKAEYGQKLEQSEKEKLLSQLPEADREDFNDLPYNQLQKIVPKLVAAQTSKPEIPSIKGSVQELKLDKPWAQMSEAEKRAFYTHKANEQAQNSV